jgi:hypothetical protein
MALGVEWLWEAMPQKLQHFQKCLHRHRAVCRQWKTPFLRPCRHSYPLVPDSKLLALGSRGTTVMIVTVRCSGNVQVSCP